jgi:CBS domain-containing protein
MKLKDVMTSNVQVVAPDATIREAAALMRALDIGPLPVCDGRRLLGVVTDRDLTVRATADGRDPNTTRVREVMSEGVVTCFEDDDVKTAAQLMQREQIRRLPVLSRDKMLVGIVSLGDLALEAGDDKLTGRTLEEISEPAQPEP